MKYGLVYVLYLKLLYFVCNSVAKILKRQTCSSLMAIYSFSYFKTDIKSRNKTERKEKQG